MTGADPALLRISTAAELRRRKIGSAYHVQLRAGSSKERRPVAGAIPMMGRMLGAVQSSSSSAARKRVETRELVVQAALLEYG